MLNHLIRAYIKKKIQFHFETVIIIFLTKFVFYYYLSKSYLIFIITFLTDKFLALYNDLFSIFIKTMQINALNFI